MSQSGGSSPFLEVPEEVVPQDERTQTLEHRLNTVQNEHEIEQLQWQRRYNALDSKYRYVLEELDQCLDKTKRVCDENAVLKRDLEATKLQDTATHHVDASSELVAKLLQKESELEDIKADFESRIESLSTQNDDLKSQVDGHQAIMQRYEDEIARQSQQIKQLQRGLQEKELELSYMAAQEVRDSHPNYTTQDLEEITSLNKLLEDQSNYTKGLEEANLQQANELKKLRISVESQNFWKQEYDKLKNQLDEYKELEAQLQETQLENIDLKSKLTSWELLNDAETELSPQEIVRELGTKQNECKALHEQIQTLQNESNNLKILNDELAMERNQLLDLEKNYSISILNLKKLNHELEQQKLLSFEECKILRLQIAELTQSDKKEENQNTKHLETLIDDYKNQTEDLTSELKKLNDQLINQEPQTKKRKTSDNITLNYTQRLNELQLANHQLTTDLTKAHSIIQVLEEKVKKLVELKEKKIRILQLRDSPLLKDQFVKRRQLDLLRQENKELLERLQGSTSNFIEQLPKSVYDTLELEYQQLQAELFKSNKRFLRLKQTYNAKSLEFIDVVNSILGFKLEFQQNGKVKIASCFQPDKHITVDLKRNTLKSNLQDCIPEWDTLLQTWVVEREQTPCFLANITLDLWSKSSSIPKSLS